MLGYAVRNRFVYKVKSFIPQTQYLTGKMVFDYWDDYYPGGVDTFEMSEVEFIFDEERDAIERCKELNGLQFD